MTSWLIDAVLVAALTVTSWRTGAMYRELKRLRTEEGGLATALRQADEAINRAAHAVVLLKSEGVRTLQALEERTGEARELGERLEILLDSYERRRTLPIAVDNENSRLASVSAAIR